MSIAFRVTPGAPTFDSALRTSVEAGTQWLRSNWEVLLLLALALAVYQPWNSRILPVTDFGTFLAERDPSDSLLEQFASLVRYYAVDGRFCLIIYLEFVLAIKAFGTWSPGWYWMYFVLNCIVLLLGRNFILRTGAKRAAAFVALALWATMGPTAEGWIRPTGEPLALIFFFVALRFAFNYSEAADWRRRAFVVAACAVGIVYSKEILVVLLPVVWLMSRFVVRDGVWTWARWSKQDAFLLGVVAIATSAALAPVVYVAMTAPQANYASLYGQSMQPWVATMRRLESVMIPAAPRLHRLVNLLVDPGWTLLFTLPNLLWVRLIVGGIITGPKRRIGWPLLMSATWITMGLIAYFPWPITDAFYMLPFAFGAMFGAAHAISCMIAESRARLRVVILVGALLIVSAAVEGRTVVYHRQLRAKLYGGVISVVAGRGGADVLIGATPEPASDRRSWARTIRGFGEATVGMRVGESHDMSCTAAKNALATTSGIVVISTEWGCGRLTANSVVVTESVPRYQWPWLWQRKQVVGRMYVATARQ